MERPGACSISSLCRNARLSLQKAALSRRSHMLSEELGHLRDFESMVSEALPLHPHFSATPQQKELLDLDLHLLTVKRRLAEIESKHPFLYRHHRQGGSAAGLRKRSKESPENGKAQNSKTPPPSSSSLASSSSSSSCAKGLLSSFLSENSTQSPPTPSKRSLSSSCLPSPRLTSNPDPNPSSSKAFRSLKRPWALRSPLNNCVDEAGPSSEKLEPASQRDTCRGDRHKLHAQKHTGSSSNLQQKLRSKCIRDHRKSFGRLDFRQRDTSFPDLELELPSSSCKHEANPSLGDVTVNRASHLSRGCSLPTRNKVARCSSPHQSFAGDKDVGNNDHTCNALSPANEDGTCNNLMDASNSDLSDKVEESDPTVLHTEISWQRSRNLEERLQLMRDYGSEGSSELYNDDVSLLNLASETIHGMRTYSTPLHKLSLHSKAKDTGRESRHSSKDIHNGFGDRDLLLKTCAFSKDSSKPNKKRAVDVEQSKLKTERALWAPLCKQTLGEAIKTAEGLQERNDNVEETTHSSKGKLLSRELLSLKCNSKIERAAKRPQSSHARTGFRGTLCTKNWNLEVVHPELRQDQEWAENAEKWEHESEDHPKRKGELDWQNRAFEDEFLSTYGVERDVSHRKAEAYSSTNADHENIAQWRERAMDAKFGNGAIASDNRTFSGANVVVPAFERISLKGSHLSVNACTSLKPEKKHIATMESLAVAGFDAETVQISPSGNQILLSRKDAISSSVSSSVLCGSAPSLPSSLSRLSPQESSEVVSSNLGNNEVDAHFYEHTNGSLSGQQVTFCNPVFDFDSNNHHPERAIRPRLRPLDGKEDAASPSEERLKSILGECANVANQLNSHRGLGLDSDSSPILEPQVSGKGPPHKDVTGNISGEHDIKLQVNELARRMDGFHKRIDELQGMVQNSSLHVQQQVDTCEAKVKSLERHVIAVKGGMESQMADLKRLMQMQFDVNHLTGGSKRSYEGSNGSFEERMQANMDECSLRLNALQSRLDTWMPKMHMQLRSEVKDAVACSMEKVGSIVRTDLEKLELQREKDLGNLKKEMGLKLSIRESKKQLNIISEKQLDFIVEDVLGSKFSHLVEMFSAEKGRELAEMKVELANLQREFEVHFQGESIWVEDNHLGVKQLHSMNGDGLETRSLVDGMKKVTDANLRDIWQSIDKLKLEALECRERVSGLERGYFTKKNQTRG